MNINMAKWNNGYSLSKLYKQYGYSQYKMSKFEEYDLYVRNKNFLISDNIITFTDTDGKLMALKPDVTLSIVKNSRDTVKSVHKVYYDENVYRVSKRSHLYKEIRQIGLECMGNIDTYCIAEVLSLAIKSLKLISNDFVLDISHMGIVSAYLDTIALEDHKRSEVLTCIGEKNGHGIRRICKENGVSFEDTEKLCELANTYGNPEKVISWLREAVKNEDGQKAIDELSNVLELVKADDGKGRVHIDFSVINDMNYYNGIVFKGFVNGVPSSILSGGQYDNLMKKMGKSSDAIGFALYPDLLEELLSFVPEYDIDAVLLYDDNADYKTLKLAVDKITGEGLSVTAQKSVPEKLRYRRLYRLCESGAMLLEDNA